MEYHRSPLVLQCHLWQRHCTPPCNVKTSLRQQSLGKSQTFPTVMVSADGNHRHMTAQHHLRKEAVQKLYRLHCRTAPVINISCQQQYVRPSLLNQGHYLLQQMLLVRQQRNLIQLFSNMQIRHMEDAHPKHLIFRKNL